MWTATTIADLRRHRLALKGRVAFVPTMGALHAGHISLVEAARGLADHVLVSVFVNPTQFGPNEDFTRYPRPIERDLAMCQAAGVAGVFNPGVEEIYPSTIPPCDVNIPSMATILEGAIRPGHFAGVCRVVLKLFNLVQPNVACFGQKDLQQLRVIQAMVADLNLPLAIQPVPTMREPDGLAMSSRNVYLKPEERRHAVGLSKALAEGRALIETIGESDPARVEAAMRQALKAHHIEPDYAVARHPMTLAPLDSIDVRQTHGAALLVAGKLGSVRLIDNVVLESANA
ncbi:MAG: pantoate--beta-alanine ligase [Planctomycetota bacterium]|nr:pantoate--beta-alanine ligase [Planctomycetota bacterium]